MMVFHSEPFTPKEVSLVLYAPSSLSPSKTGTVMEDQSTYEAQQEVIHPDDCSNTAPQSHQSEHQHDPSPSSDTHSSSSSAGTHGSSSPACEDSGAEEESISVAASHRDASPEPESPMDAAQPGNVELQTDTIGPGAVMEGTGDTVDTGQDVPHAGEVEEALKLEEGGEDHEPQEQDIPENTPELELEENGNGVELLDIINVSVLDDMAKRIQVEEVRNTHFSVNLVQIQMTKSLICYFVCGMALF